MSFQTPLTIKAVLASIEKHQYVLPAIQREFVWTPEQIIALMDSLMRGYPVGSFLFWQVDADKSHDYRFYDFVLDYHQKDNPHCPLHQFTEPRDLVAVLDGQQRLTSLNIAFRGSMSVKEKHKRRNDPKAYPRKILHLNLSRAAFDNEQGHHYDFRFLSPQEAKAEDDLYYPLTNILGINSASKTIHQFVVKNQLAENDFSFDALYGLYQLVHEKGTISSYLETEQNLDRVLNIFIRVNSGATKLSYSDLLMSIAAAQWSEHDARQMVHGLVDDLNAIGDGYSFSKDFVLKAGLMLSDIASVGFKVENFNAKNMEQLRQQWDAVASTLTTTVSLLDHFGLSDAALSADSALLPIAYFLHQHPEPDKFLSASKYRASRENVRLFLVRSLLKRGVWGSGLDVTLTALRSILRDHKGHDFPLAAMERALSKRGRSLFFDEAEIDDLLTTSYGHKRAIPLLSLLFDHIDLRHKIHVDHVYPKARLSRSQLKRAGLDSDLAALGEERRDQLPNLQLLEGMANQEKSKQLPADWLEQHFAHSRERQQFCNSHLLGELPEGPDQFADFFETRRQRMKKRLAAILAPTSAS